MSPFTPVRLLARAALCALLSAPAVAQQARTDLVFIVDNSLSMGGDIAAVRDGVGRFAQELAQNQIDARYALIAFGCRPRLELDLTSDPGALTAALGQLQADAGSPEAGLEAIRMALGVGPQAFENPPSGSDGRLAFRRGARINLILVTDEDSDLAYYPVNRIDGQPCTASNASCPGCMPCNPTGSCGDAPSGTNSAFAPWQAEVDATAAAVLEADAYVNMVIRRGAWQTEWQYGDPSATVLDAFGLLDRAATYESLFAQGVHTSLQGQVLAGGGLARAFEIRDIGVDLDNDGVDDLVEDLIETKVAETVNLPPVFVAAPRGTCEASPLSGEVGGAVEFDVQVAPPETYQSIDVSLAQGNPANVSLTVAQGPNGTATATIRFEPDATQTGAHTLRIVATDDGLPRKSTSLEVCVVVEELVEAFCFPTECPCQNTPASPGTGCVNSTGRGGVISAKGNPSVAGPSFDVSLTDLPRGTFSILYAGGAPASVPFGQGIACVSPGPHDAGSPGNIGVVRLARGPAFGGVSGFPDVVGLFRDAGLAMAPGQTVYLQGFYRNPRFTCPGDPGATFNFTNGLRVTFVP